MGMVFLQQREVVEILVGQEVEMAILGRQEFIEISGKVLELAALVQEVGILLVVQVKAV